MTESEFLALEPRERDALVAEKVMGWKMVRVEGIMADSKWDGKIKNFYPTSLWGEDTPTDLDHLDNARRAQLADAWRIVEKGQLDHLGWNAFYKAWDCDVTIKGKMGRARADTAPLAICIAALKAKGVIE